MVAAGLLARSVHELPGILVAYGRYAATRIGQADIIYVGEGLNATVAVLERVAARAPAVTFTGPDGTGHQLWVISDPAIHASVHAALENLPVLIADGHHRYETALAYAEEVDEGPDAPSRFTLAVLTDLADPGLVVLPTHRVMKTGIPVTGGERKATLEETLASLRGEVAAGWRGDGERSRRWPTRRPLSFSSPVVVLTPCPPLPSGEGGLRNDPRESSLIDARL